MDHIPEDMLSYHGIPSKSFGLTLLHMSAFDVFCDVATSSLLFEGQPLHL